MIRLKFEMLPIRQEQMLHLVIVRWTNGLKKHLLKYQKMDIEQVSGDS